MSFARIGEFIAAAILAFVCGSPDLMAQAPQHTDGFHLDMTLHWSGGDTVENIKADRFWVEQGGMRLQAAVRNGGKQPAGDSFLNTRVLVVLDRSIQDPEKMLKGLMGSFKGLWKLGWETAVIRPDGSATAYAASPTSIAPAVPAAGSYEQAYDEAVTQLGEFPGRKLVLYLPGPLKRAKTVTLKSDKAKIVTGTGNSFVPVGNQPARASVPTSLVQGAARSIAVLYVVDGGDPAFGGYSHRGGYSYSPEHSWFKEGIKHEPADHDAFTDMRRDARGYYDLYITPEPGHSIDPHQPITVKISVLGSLQVISQTSGIGNGLPIEVSQR